MVFSFLTEDNLFDLFGKAKDYTERLTEPFAEYSRIVRNKPHPDTPKNFPKTTDGTAASIVRKTPKRSIQQLPSGVIESDKDHDHWPIIADFVYRSKILPLANAEYDLIQKCRNTVEDGQTFGSQAIYTPLINHDGEYTPDYILPYWGDIFLQPGKKSGYDCNYLFLRSWWQVEDIESLIANEEARIKESRAEHKKYKSYWDMGALRELKEAATPKDDKATTPAERDLNLNPEAIEIITGFQKGTGNTFYTFSPGKVLIVRRKPNNDPRGKYPIDWYYYDTDGSNPLGRSLIDLIGPLQNLIDSDMQAYQFNRAIQLQPPLTVRGTLNKNKVIYAPNILIDLGSDPNNKVEALRVDTSAISDYPNLYGLQKSQMLNLVTSPDTSISAEVGNPGFGKTPAAINTQNAQISVDDNAVRKDFEASFENWSETAVNMFFAERSGMEELQLDEETANKLRDLEREGYLDPGYVKDNNTIIVNYDEATEALRFRINASTSKVNSEAAQLEALQVVVQTLDSSQSLSEVVPLSKKLAVWNAIVANSGVENSDDLKVTEEELANMQAPRKGITEPDLDATGASEQIPGVATGVTSVTGPTAPPEISILDELATIGVPDDLLTEVPGMISKGYTDDEIIASIEGVLKQEQEVVV